MSEDSYLNNRVLVKVGDICQEHCDAIVNAANSTLMGGGGVDGAIHRGGGPKILEECKQIRKNLPNGLPTGEAVLTTGGNLFAKYVIHTVGPIWGGGQSGEAELLANCYANAIKVAVMQQIKTLAFLAISTGIYGYPAHLAAQVASKTLKKILLVSDSITQVSLIFFHEKDRQIFRDNQLFNH